LYGKEWIFLFSKYRSIELHLPILINYSTRNVDLDYRSRWQCCSSLQFLLSCLRFSIPIMYNHVQLIYKFFSAQGQKFHCCQLQCPPEGWKISFFPWNFFHKIISMLIMYAKFQGQKIYTKKDIWNLPCEAMRKIHYGQLWHPPKDWNFFLLPWNFCHEITSMLILCVPNFKVKRLTPQRDLKSTNMCFYWDNFTTPNFDTLLRAEILFFYHDIFVMKSFLY